MHWTKGTGAKRKPSIYKRRLLLLTVDPRRSLATGNNFAKQQLRKRRGQLDFGFLSN